MCECKSQSEVVDIKGKKKASKVKGKAKQADGTSSASEVYTVKLGVKIETELAS
ncbi:MAG: hypothetical protein IJS50_00465 [Desulfovibrio sp.]|nr:hypothetical protein [Desulfovibrio sp.]